MTIAGFNCLSFARGGLAAAFSLVCTATCTLALLAGPAAAQGTPEQRQACQPDAMRLCSEFVPDVDRITACMVKQRMRLSPACRAVFTTPAKTKSFKHSS